MSPSSEAKARVLLDQKLLELGSPAPSTSAAIPTVTPPTPSGNPENTVLPPEEQLKAEAAARREREKTEAEAARQKIREEQRQMEIETKAQKADARAKADLEKKMKAQAEKDARLEAKAREDAKKEAKKARVTSNGPEVEQPKAKSNEPLVRTWEIPNGKSKEQRLADLYDAYSRDLISASEYHRARAKIVSEP